MAMIKKIIFKMEMYENRIAFAFGQCEMTLSVNKSRSAYARYTFVLLTFPITLYLICLISL